MESLAIASYHVFVEWVEEERAYLADIPEVPVEDVLKVNLLQTLLQLEEAE